MGNSQPSRGRSAADAPGSAVARGIVLGAVVIALIARLVSVQLAPKNSYLWDHICNMGWSAYAYEHGPQRLYDYDRSEPLVVNFYQAAGDSFQPRVWKNPHLYNYPPGSAYVFWFKGWLWSVLEPTPVTVPIRPADARNLGRTGEATARLSNTFKARLVSAAPAVLFDFLMAWGVARLVRASCGIGRRSRVREAVALAITLLAPPVFLDSAFWGQADSWISAALVWCVALLIERRLTWAGIAFGIGITLKPQAILLAPVLLYVALALRFMPGGSWGELLRLWRFAAGAAGAVALIAGPTMLHDARAPGNTDGALRWIQRSYVGTIGDDRYSRITLNAFNAWWLHMAVYGTSREAQDSNSMHWSGMTNATVGKLSLAACILVVLALAARKWRWDAPSWLPVTMLVLLAAFALPTKVHERYIYYCIPFAIALACLRPALWAAPLGALLIVGTAEMVSFSWVRLDDARDIRLGTALALLTLLTLLYGIATLIPRVRPTPVSADVTGHPTGGRASRS